MAVVKTYRVRLGTDETEVTVGEEADGALRVSLAGAAHRVDVAEIVPGRHSLIVDGLCHDLCEGQGTESRAASGPSGPGDGRRRWTVTVDGETYTVEVAGRTSGGRAGPAQAAHASEVRASMPGLLVALQVAEGSEVAAGQPLIIMEAMKMQMEIRAPRAGTVRRVHVRAGQEIAGDQLLVTIE